MNLRFAAIITGCMLAGAAAAAYHRFDSRPRAEPTTPLFLQAAIAAPTTATWPPSGPVAFYQEMRALVSTGPTQHTSPYASQQQMPQQAPPGTGGAPPPPTANDTVEIVIRDRFGRPIRVERVDRRMLAPPQGYPQQSSPRPPYHFYGPQAQGPYSPYGPYRR